MDGFVASIFGQRGSGKSTLMNEIINPCPRVILFDFLPTRAKAAAAMGFQHVTTIDQVTEAIMAGYVDGFRIWFQPERERHNQQKALSELSENIWKIQAAQYADVGEVPFITLAVDELSASCPITNLASDVQGFINLLTAGRHMAINIIGASQRPAQVHSEFRSATEVKYFLQLSEPLDLKVVRETAGDTAFQAVPMLQTLEYIRYQTGKLSRGKTQFLF